MVKQRISKRFDRKIALIILFLATVVGVNGQNIGEYPAMQVGNNYLVRFSTDGSGAATTRCEVIPKRLVEAGDDQFTEGDRANALSANQFKSLLYSLKKRCDVGSLKRPAKSGFSGGGKDFYVDEYRRAFVEKMMIGENRILAAKIYPIRNVTGKLTASIECSPERRCAIGIDNKKFFVSNHSTFKIGAYIEIRAAGPIN